MNLKCCLKVTLTLIFYLSLSSLFSQAPNYLSFQTVVRNGQNALVQEKPISLRISILQGSENGPSILVERHNVNTNLNGLATLNIGKGISIQGNFLDIDWGNGPYFIKTEVSLINDDLFNLTGVSQILSVPYALYSEVSGTTKKIVDIVRTKANEWNFVQNSSGFSYYVYNYVNPKIDDKIINSGSIQVYSLYNPGNLWQTWPFTSQSNGASYNVIISKGNISLRAESAPSAPVTDFKIVITP